MSTEEKLQYLLSVGYTQDTIESCTAYWKEEDYDDEEAIIDDLEDGGDEGDGSAIIQHLQEKYDWNEEQTKDFYLKLRQALDLDVKSPKVPSIESNIDSGGSDDSKTNDSMHLQSKTPLVYTTKPPSPKDSKQSIVVKLISTEITDEEKKQISTNSKFPLKKRITSTAPLLLPASSSGGFLFGAKKEDNNAQDILTIELLGHKNQNYPLLLHFVDSLIRCRMNEWITCGCKLQYKISTRKFFDDYCKHPHFQQFWNSVKSQDMRPKLQTAIDSYLHRILPQFQMMDPIYKIDSNPLDLCNYMFEMARIARNAANQPVHNFTTIIPLQIDFLVLNAKIKDVRAKAKDAPGIAELFADDPEDDEDDEDDESEEDDDEQKEYIPKDMDQFFKNKKIKYMVYENPLREMLRCTEDIKRMIDNKRCQRAIFALDRRNNENKDSDQCGTKGDKLYLFKPKKYNKFEENPLDLIHESLHYNSIVSILPRPDKKNQDFTARESLRGQMFVMSFHIMSKDEIRCYLFYQGQCFRFFGEDLINVLPILFVDGKRAKEIMKTKLSEPKWRKSFEEFCSTFVDERFERFYYGLTGQGPRIKVQ